MAQHEAPESFPPRIRQRIDRLEKPELEYEMLDLERISKEDKADMLRLFEMHIPKSTQTGEGAESEPPLLWGKRCVVARDINARAADGHIPIIGMIHLDITTRGSRTTGMISSFSLDPQYRGMGIGSPLLDKSIDAASEAGAQAVLLQTDEITSQEAKKMYRRRRFCAIERFKHNHTWYNARMENIPAGVAPAEHDP